MILDLYNVRMYEFVLFCITSPTYHLHITIACLDSAIFLLKWRKFMTFSELNLNPAILAALPSSIKTPTRIQNLAIPAALSQNDVLALAQTGSGKTLAFGLPLLQQIDAHSSQDADHSIHGLILVPTRELATQVSHSLQAIASALDIRITTLCGGISQEEQVKQLHQRPQLVVATPGRLLDLTQKGFVDLSTIKALVLDEADRLLDMGFWPDIQKILAQMPTERQSALFSATLPGRLDTLAMEVLNKPLRLEANAANSVVEEIEEQLYLVNKGSKAQALLTLIKQSSWSQVLVFISARDNADSLAKKLTKAGISVAALHGNKDQSVREQTLADFKSQKVQVLIATDLLARGIHVEALPVVINFDLPPSAPVYVHRVGRTARAGQSGLAISLVCHGESEALSAIRSLTKRSLPLRELSGFPVTDKPTAEDSNAGERKRAPRDKQANRRSAKKRSIKQFKSKPAN